MDLSKATVVITGSNRGLGREFVKAFNAAKVKKIYAAARDLSTIRDLGNEERISPIALDITDDLQVKAAAKNCSDANLLINNAGKNFNVPLIGTNSIEATRTEVETNYLGTLQMCRAFAPVLKANNGGMIVNIISLLARVSIPAIGSVCGSKAALLLMTNGIRAELGQQNTHVMGVLPGPIDTDMTPGGESDPADIAAMVLKGISDDEEEIWPGAMAENVYKGLLDDPKAVEKEFATYLPE
mgnify:FL=1